jgi:serine/threonine-protein kinase HipA
VRASTSTATAGRSVARRTLGVWLHGTHVAEITDGGPGRVICRYTSDALERWSGGTPLLSCFLPVSGRRRSDAGVWFRGLLPEGQALQAMASAARVASYDTIGMLARFGRDVAGAVVISDRSIDDRPGGIVPYTPDTLTDEIVGLDDRPLALYDDSELSLPGLQNKMLLVALDGGWARPVGGRPSTHILKTEDRRFPGLAEHEAACLHLARALGLTTIDAWTEAHGAIGCLIVSRYDRAVAQDGRIVRLHQEDACQALGIDPERWDRRGKYEAHGGPSLVQVAGLLDRYATDPVHELEQLARSMTFTVAIGNADAHGKNLAFVHDPPGSIRLGPLYDTVPTVCWERLPTRAAMSVNGRTELALRAHDSITVEDLLTEAAAWRLEASRAERAVIGTLEALAVAAGELELPEPVAALVTSRCRQLLGPA